MNDDILSFPHIHTHYTYTSYIHHIYIIYIHALPHTSHTFLPKREERETWRRVERDRQIKKNRNSSYECIELIFVFMETTIVDIQPLYIFSCIFILALLTYYLYIYIQLRSLASCTPPCVHSLSSLSFDNPHYSSTHMYTWSIACTSHILTTLSTH